MTGYTAANRRTIALILDQLDPLFVTPGELVEGQWKRIFAFARLRMTGTGTVTIDARNALGDITAGVAEFTLTDATNEIAGPNFGNDAVEIRATFTGTATAEIM